MRYRFGQEDLDDWEDELVVRYEEDDKEPGFQKEGPDTALGRLFVEGHPTLFHPPEEHRPGLFDVQMGAIALAAHKVWDELLPALGMVQIRHLQLEKVAVERYSSIDPSEIEDGEVLFRVEAEATYPQYRRSALNIPVKIVGGRARGGLMFVDNKGRKWPLTKEAMERYLGVKDWFVLSREPTVPIAQIDRVVHTDYPYYMRSRLMWDIGF
jgi:hypothetical protein